MLEIVRNTLEIISKGVPARESRTGTRLVSPATGSEKKIGGLHNRASECKIEYIRNIISIHRYYGEWYNSRKAPKTRKQELSSRFLGIEQPVEYQGQYAYLVRMTHYGNERFTEPCRSIAK